MADDDKTEDAATEADGQPEKKSKKKFIILIAVAAFIVLAGGGGAAFFLLSGGDSASSEADHASSNSETSEVQSKEHEESSKPQANETTEVHEEKSSEHPQDGSAKDEQKAASSKAEEGSNIDFGQTYTFKTFHLNLGNPLENHYVRLEVAVEFRGGETQKQEIQAREPQLRDAIVSLASRKTREFLLGPDGKDQLRREIQNRINRYMSQPIEAVYITDILIE